MVPPVVILTDLDNPALAEAATSVKQQLDSRYGISVVRVRSCHLPFVRIANHAQKNPTTKLFVGLGLAETPLFVRLRETTLHPIVTISPNESSDSASFQIAKILALSDPTISKLVQGQVDTIQSHHRSREQSLLTEDADRSTHGYLGKLRECYDTQRQIIGDHVIVSNANRFRGKVRDRWEPSDTDTNTIALVTTDRQSGFDRQLAVVPYKGAVLNLCSAFWFDQMKDIIPNHIVSIPHPSVTIAKRCDPFPIEFVVR